jgi:hypothetical protein
MNTAARNGNFFENSMGKSKYYIGGFFSLSIKHLLAGGRKCPTKILSGFIFIRGNVMGRFSLVLGGNACKNLVIMFRASE